jgi:hypothetical protein
MSVNILSKNTLYRGSLIIGVLSVILIGAIAAWHQGGNIDAGYLVMFTEQNLAKLGLPNNFKISQSFPAEYVATYGYSVQIWNHYVGELVTWILGEKYSINNGTVYSVRNVITFLVSLLAYWGVYQIIRNITASKFFGWLGVVFLAVIGTSTGNGFYNDKDVPLASGLILLIAVLVNAYLYNNRRVKSSSFIKQTSISLFFGISLTIGSRPGFWPVIVVLLVAIFFVVRKQKKMRSSLIWSVVISMFYVVATNGYLLRSPIWWLENSLTMSTKFPWSGATMIHSTTYPGGYRWYLSFMVAIQTPLVILILFVASVPLTAFFLISRRLRSQSRYQTLIVVNVLLIGFSVGLIFLATVQSSVTYDGARQFLFVYPILAATAAITAWLIFINLHNKIFRILMTVGLSVGILLPAIATLQLFPYQHVYTSEWSLWDTRSSDNMFDNQGVSSKETQEWINQHYRDQKIAIIPEQTFVPYLEDNQLVPTGDKELRLYAQIWRPALIPDYFNHCKQVFSVSRSQFWNKRLLSYVRDCTEKAS